MLVLEFNFFKVVLRPLQLTSVSDPIVSMFTSAKFSSTVCNCNFFMSYYDVFSGLYVNFYV